MRKYYPFVYLAMFTAAAPALFGAELKTAPPPALATGSAATAAAPVKSSDLIAAAKKIDQFINDALAKNKIKPQPQASELTFLRRAYLDIAGRNPTFDEIKSYMAVRDRRKLIDRLLESEAAVQHGFNYWADLLRVKSNFIGGPTAQPYIQYIKQSLRENKPYNQWAYEMLSAEGRLIDNPATGYYLRDEGMPLDNMAVTTRVFLGTSIGCAQCHDHPFDKWTQLEFYRLGAFNYGLNYRDDSVITGETRRKLDEMRKNKEFSVDLEGLLNAVLNANDYGLGDDKGRQLKLPDDYKYDDAKPGATVEAATLFGAAAKVSADTSPRQAFAKWVTARENPRFALNIANRLWKKIMGAGLYEPIDEITDKSVASHPELMKFLADQMIAMNFSLRDFQRMIYYTDAYQREALLGDLGPDQPYVYQGRLVTRLTAEQMWDSLIALISNEPDALAYNTTPYGLADVRGKNAEQIIAMIKSMKDDMDKKNGPSAGSMMMGMNADKLTKLGPGVVRSAAMDSPAPAGHFMRNFGQSDRDRGNGGSTSPNISQVLNLLNGEIDYLVLNPESQLMKSLAATNKSADKINLIFLSILARQPSSGELQVCLGELNRGKEKGIGNVIWALLNTREFMFNH